MDKNALRILVLVEQAVPSWRSTTRRAGGDRHPGPGSAMPDMTLTQAGGALRISVPTLAAVAPCTSLRRPWSYTARRTFFQGQCANTCLVYKARIPLPARIRSASVPCRLITSARSILQHHRLQILRNLVLGAQNPVTLDNQRRLPIRAICTSPASS